MNIPHTGIRVHLYDRGAGNAAIANHRSHFCSSTSVSVYVKFGEKLGVNERAMSGERVKPVK
jgi:hypothetical protein